MTDRVLLSAGQKNIEACVDLAARHGLGLEVMAFAYPDVLDGDWKATLERYRAALRPVRGMVAMHGPFMDMAPGSPDSRVTQVCAERYRHAIRIAGDLGAEIVVFHANFIAAIHSESYRTNWQARSVQFWGEMSEYARRYGVLLTVENMWEFDPDIIGDVLRTVAHPNLRACLDVGHTHLFSDVPFANWLETLAPYLAHLHLNNNDGKADAHRALGDGVIDYDDVLARIRALPRPPTMTLEMDTADDLHASLTHFHLPQPEIVWRNGARG